MAEAELGLTFAIHGGGLDLVFPHHENEIAQSEAARGVPLARIWMHNGMVEIDEEKMSKSEGNIFQLSEALDRFERETVVAYLVSGHYRQPLAFSEEALEQAASGVERLRNFLREQGTEGGVGEEAAAYRERFLDALADDFNTPKALAEAFELVAEANRRELPGAGAALVEMLEVIGLESLARPEEAPDHEALQLLAEREEAREERDFERADKIRDQLAALGWEVRDGPDGARLVRRT
jgi:cysteinyl-tRNA synthetase